MDKERILSKIDELNQYIKELEKIRPKTFEEYKNNILIKRACERLLQVSIECIIDIASILVKELKIGLPSEEEDLFDKLEENGIITRKMKDKLRLMRGFRNILVHRYGKIDDKLVFENLSKIQDFKDFSKQIIEFLKNN